MKPEEWSLIVALISAVGAIGSAIFAYQQKQIANQAKEVAMKQTKIAEESKEASLRSAEAAETSSKTAEEAVGEGFRPYVIVKMYCLDLKLYFEITNIGNRIAKDIHIKIDPNFDDLKDLQITGKAAEGVKKLLFQKFLSPGHSIRTVVAYNSDYLKLKKDENSDIRNIGISYKSILANLPNEEISFNEEYFIDIRTFLIDEKYADRSDNKSLSDIAKKLDRIANSLSSSPSKFMNQMLSGRSDSYENER